MNRSRGLLLLLLALTVSIGLSSRMFGNYLPEILAAFAPDILWALMVYWLLGFIFPGKPIWWISLAALIFSYAIECSQLYHAPFIDSIRATTIGGLILGYTFIWADLICYTVGVLIGAFSERFFLPRA
jgi:hypothetical protein